ncbi:hypothetical protein IAT38_002223 [Cryptococcus sp. DSM 104549]
MAPHKPDKGTPSLLHPTPSPKKGKSKAKTASSGTPKPKSPHSNARRLSEGSPKAAKTPVPPHQHVPAPAPVHVPEHKTGKLSWLMLLALVTALPLYFFKLHYRLPEPQRPYDDAGRPQPAEANVLAHIQALEDIGYRTVGTYEALAGEKYVLDQVLELVERCNAGAVLNCEWFHQKGSGFHAFEIIDHEVLKAYVGISNIILKISAFHPPSYNVSQPHLEQDAILLGAHIDSTMPSPGASDDGIGAGVMLEVARVLVERNEPFGASIIFLWNSGEETLQDASHLYSTEHVTAPSVKAMINLEAAGSTGGALLFQATSKEMIEAYSHAPHPRGTVIAADVFASGILMSDTDFGQFEKYLGVSGLDMAIVGHSYFYHTQRDTIEHIERGAAQHFASNIQAIVDHLLSPSSPLLSPAPFSPPDIAYLSLFDLFFVQVPMDQADKVYTALAGVVIALVVRNVGKRRWKAAVVAGVGIPLGMVGGLVSANLLAFTLSAVGKGQIWFRNEHLPLLIYVPAGFIGHLTVQLLLSKTLSPTSRTQLEQTHYYLQLFYSALYMLLLQVARIRSAYLFAMITSLLLAGAVGNELGRASRKGESEGLAFRSTYLVPTAGLIALSVEAATTALDIFTPLAGRMGKDAPAEHIIATLSVGCGFIFLSPSLPLFHRTSRRTQRKVILALALFHGTVVTLLAGPWYFPYDAMHPKRVGMMYCYNHTADTHTAHLAFMDRGPIADIPSAIHERYALPGAPLEHTVLTDYDSDWDMLYPVSTFLDTYRFTLPVPEEVEGFKWPKMEWEEVEGGVWEDGKREMTLKFDFTGLVWPTLAFEADVLEWSFHFPPPDKNMRHHIKIATSADDTVAQLTLTVRADKGEKLKIDWSAFDLNQMVPGTASRLGPNMPASKMLLDLSAWSVDRYQDDLDYVMSGVVCGVIEV